MPRPTSVWRAILETETLQLSRFGATEDEAWQKISDELFERDLPNAPDLLSKIKTEEWH